MSKERLDYIYEKMVRSAKKVRRSSRLPVSRYGIGGSINWNEVRRDLRKAKPIEGLDGSERQKALIGPLNEYIEQTHGLGISFQGDFWWKHLDKPDAEILSKIEQDARKHIDQHVQLWVDDSGLPMIYIGYVGYSSED